MARLGLETEIVDQGVYANTVRRFKNANIVLPTFAQLADPRLIPSEIIAAVDKIDPDAPHPLNLFRVHWYNGANRSQGANVPGYLVLPSSLTGVRAPIAVLLGSRFPMIATHKVLAAYGCLAPRIVTGQFDPTKHRAIWPSTGNYCRGGVAISRIMRCHGVAVLPELMSQERFDWLNHWVLDPADIIVTPGSESNVKEIYDECARLDRVEENIIFNQFCEFGNHLVHYECTGKAAESVFESMLETDSTFNLRAFVSATGSGGTIAAGDYLKERYGSQTVAVEALECPTLLYNGFGEHNIQGIGDKHVPLIHNTMSTDFVTAVSDEATDNLNILFNTAVGRQYLAQRHNVPAATVRSLGELGLSSICNVLAAIKLAKHLDLTSKDVVLTVATDSAAMYQSELAVAQSSGFRDGFDQVGAAEVYGQFIMGMATDHIAELTHVERKRIFNLGYYTWVEQQGVSIDEFNVRKEQEFWTRLRELLPVWDEMIQNFNREVQG